LGQQERHDQYGSAQNQSDYLSADPMMFTPQDSTLLNGMLPSPDSPGVPTSGRAPIRGEDGQGRLLQAVLRTGSRHDPGCGTATPKSGPVPRL